MERSTLSTKPFRILLVDDDPTDRELFSEALDGHPLPHVLEEAGNGVAALERLRGGVLPSLVVLDLNMPVMDGRETLRELRAEAAWRHIPVCILSTSSAHFDVQQAYADGANLFLVKPLDFRSLQELTGSLLALFSKYSVTL